MTEEIRIPEPELTSVAKILVDKKNPNRMSEKEYAALKKNIRKFGFLIPIITNKKLVIADGYHRWKAAHELGITDVPVIRLDMSEVDRRILRQVMNKLRGEHDTEMDQEEFEYLLKNDSLKELNELLGGDADIEILLGDDSPADEKEFDENLQTDNQCPSCGYRW